MNELFNAFRAVQKSLNEALERADYLEDVIDNLEEDVVSIEHYASLKDDLADLILLVLSGTETDNMIQFLLHVYFSKNERENILKESGRVKDGN